MGYDDKNIGRVKDRLVMGLFALVALAVFFFIRWLITGRID